MEPTSIPPSNESVNSSASDTTPPLITASTSVHPGTSPKLKLMFIAIAGLLAVGLVTFAVLALSKPKSAPETQTSNSQNLLGAITTVVDGSVEVSQDGKTWQALKPDTTLKQGDSIHANDGGRVVITLDDGSAIRLNSASTVKLASLAATNVQISNQAGEVYTRVVKSDRTFSVTVGDESYVALGTAYKTVNSSTVKGVEVYQSEVSAKKAAQKITEGKRYYQANSTAELDKKVSDIPLDQLQKDDFLKWNLEHDKKSDEFKDKLGYFKNLEATPVPALAPKPTPAPTTPTGIVLSGSVKAGKGVSLTWKVTGLTVGKGFKVVKGLSANPSYGKNDATFVEATARSYTWGIKDGKTYHFRVCIYTEAGCTNYSNDITVTAPYVAPPAPPSGSLSLSHVSGNNVSWVLSGSASYGLKLVWSTATNPTYPGSSAKYFDGASNSSATFDADPGTYYVRVCMYYEGSCTNYSNEVMVTLP